MVEDLTQFLYTSNMLRYIEGYVQKVNPQKAPNGAPPYPHCQGFGHDPLDQNCLKGIVSTGSLTWLGVNDNLIRGGGRSCGCTVISLTCLELIVRGSMKAEVRLAAVLSMQ